MMQEATAQEGWSAILEFLATQQPLLDTVIAIAWVFFIYYTIKTFQAIKRQTDELKRQTDLQSEAFLVVSSESCQTDVEAIDKIGAGPADLFDRWRGILDRNKPDALEQRADRMLVLHLQNRGRSDIMDWSIEVSADVRPGDHLRDDFNITGEEVEWVIDQEGADEVINEDDSIDIVIARMGVFPEVDFQWTVKYEDMRGNELTRFGGDVRHSDRNLFALRSNEEAADEAVEVEHEDETVG